MASAASSSRSEGTASHHADAGSPRNGRTTPAAAISTAARPSFLILEREDERVIVTPLLLQDLQEQRRRSRDALAPVGGVGLDLDHRVVETLSRRDGVAPRAAPKRVIAGDGARFVEAGGHMSEDPVVVAVAREVL